MLPAGTSLGYYSAGLNKRDDQADIICAGIQSVYKKAFDLERRDLVIVDECHRIGTEENSQYQRFLTSLQKANPHLAVVGLSATPFRTGEGCVTDGGYFDCIAYESKIDELISAGYLSPVTNQPAETEVSMQGVQIRRGEFVQKQMEDAFSAYVAPNVHELVKRARGRKSIIVFASGVTHAEAIAEMIERLAKEEAGLVVGSTLPLERQASLESFRAGRLRWMVNCNVLTEGFDAPGIDCVAMLRATVSPGLFAQAVGRGFRTSPGKKDCLVLDFGGNISRHGSLNDPEFGKLHKPKGEGGAAPHKTCENCGNQSPAGASICGFCNAVFPEREPQELDDKPDEENTILAQPQWMDVMEADLSLHKKRDNPDSRTLRADYQIHLGLRISEWVCIEHEGWARRKACRWFADHCRADCPKTIDEALDLWQDGAMRMPAKILAVKEGRFWRIIDRLFDEERPETWEESEVFEDLPF